MYGGDQTVGEQKNDADVEPEAGQRQRERRPRRSRSSATPRPTNYQGNGNEADATVTQSNEADQSQSSTQKQSLDQDGGSCCGGQSQTGEQTTYVRRPDVGEQKNDADVNQNQGNGNVNVSPAIAIFGDAKTKNAQGNGNTATANVDQSNSADQSQSSTQKQSLAGRGCRSGSKGENGHLLRRSEPDRRAEGLLRRPDRRASRRTTPTSTQKQGNGNLNISPAFGLGGWKEHAPCNSRCEAHGDRTVVGPRPRTTRATATPRTPTSTSPTRSRSRSRRRRSSTSRRTAATAASRRIGPQTQAKPTGERTCCCDGPSQTGEQKAYFGDQTVGEQKNDADVTQKQGNWNVNVSPAIGLGGEGRSASCNSKCEKLRGSSLGGDAETTNYQGNGNEANANVGQSNSADQSQTSYQRQNVVDMCKGLVYR